VRFRYPVTAAVLALVWLATAPPPAPAQVPEDKALGRPAIASSVEPARSNGPCSEILCAAGMATDGRDDTRWGSAWVDTAWWQVDLGGPRQVDSVALTWHRARPARYLIETSLDGLSFATATTVNLALSDAQIAELIVSRRYTETTRFEARSARYVRVSSLERAPLVIDGETYRFGVSLWTASVFGPADNGSSATGSGSVRVPAPATATPPAASPFAPATGPAVVSGLMRPFPVVRIKGRVTATGARIDLLSVTAPRDATIRVRCRGRSCPARVRKRVGGRARITELHRALAAGTVVTVRVTRPENYGKYTRFVIRRGRPPARTDRCVRGSARRPVRCPAAGMSRESSPGLVETPQ
jgi:F5/8 type C domain